MQFYSLHAVNEFGISRELDHAPIIELANDMAASTQTMLAQDIHDGRFLIGAYLNHRAKLFVEQRTQGKVIASLTYLTRPVLGIAPVTGVLALGDQNIDIDRQSRATRKGHFA